MTPGDALTLLAFDYGTRRIGVAVGQTVSRTASALTTLKVKNGKPPWAQIGELVEQWRPNLLVLGLPRYRDDNAHPMTPVIEKFSRSLNGRYGLAVEFVDEHLSSYAASELRRGQEPLDGLAAQMILQTWFEQAAAEKAS